MATVTVLVNTPPIAANDSAQTRSDTAVTINVLANDLDPDGSLNPGTVTVVSPPASGSAVVNPDGTITYTPGTTLGNNTFTYTIKDNLGVSRMPPRSRSSFTRRRLPSTTRLRRARTRR